MSPSSLNIRKATLALTLVGSHRLIEKIELAEQFEAMDREAEKAKAALDRSYNLPRAQGADV
jgi:hypothetical protein